MDGAFSDRARVFLTLSQYPSRPMRGPHRALPIDGNTVFCCSQKRRKSWRAITLTRNAGTKLSGFKFSSPWFWESFWGNLIPALAYAWSRSETLSFVIQGIFLFIIIGVLLGHFYPQIGEQMKPLGDGFVKLIKMLIAPIIFCTVVHGIARMVNVARVGRVALKAIIYFEVLTTIALAIGLAAVNLWQPGRGMNVNLAQVDTSAMQPYLAHTHTGGVTQFLTNIIPGTFVGAFTDGNVLQILLISVLCAFALTQVGERGKPVVDFIEAASRMLFSVVGIVMWAPPLGALGVIA